MNKITWPPSCIPAPVPLLAMVVSGLAMKDPELSHQPTNDVELLDFSPVKDKSPLPRVADLPHEMTFAVSAFVGGKAIICGGGDFKNHCFTYFQKVNQWRRTVSMDSNRYALCEVMPNCI